MQYHRLGHSDLLISSCTLGTMTFGEQNTEAEAHAQLSLALEHGVNCIDVAEMYPVPARAETQGRSELMVGRWLARQARDRLVLATKVAGPNRGMNWIRDPLALTPEQIEAALHGSLRRLHTDYIDLYQIHWPSRQVPMFGQSEYQPDPEPATPAMLAQLEALAHWVAQGKIRYIGLSNETPWGISEFIRLAEAYQLPRVVSVQNVYNLLLRVFEIGLNETCHRERLSLLVYSPLAFGLLSGKYLQPATAQGRMQLFPQFGGRYHKPMVTQAVADYVQLAQAHGLDPAQMALAWVKSRWFVGSTIIGATHLAQLQSNLAAFELSLSPELEAGIQAIHQRCPNPAF